MSPEIEKLWELADEQLEQHETQGNDATEAVRIWYHEGWQDALRWLMDVLEEEGEYGNEGHGHHEDGDEDPE
jgi:hypothetical protein|tara:strand:+ start:200 stop:415 length:216 start_codon:yes stop_codon:yes gene_type:complete